MRIQCAADLHGKKDRFETFLFGIREHSPDLIVLAGDINSSPHFSQFLERVRVALFAVTGNMDSSSTRELLAQHAMLLDGKVTMIQGLSVVGIGNHCTPGTDLYSLEKDRWISFEKTPIDILLSHAPPKGILDQVRPGYHIGNEWVQTIIEKKKPRLAICGHAHEDYGYRQYHDTIVINCSIGDRGAYTLVDIEDTTTVRMCGY